MGLSAGCGGCLVCAGWFLVGWLWCGGRVLCAACVLRCVCGCCGVRGVCWLPVAVCWCVRVCVCWWGRGGAGGGALSGSGAVRPVGGSVVAGWLPAAVCLLWFLPVFWLVGLRGGWWVGGGWLVWAGWL